ncbi:MAG: hypothetical protein FJ137_12630 [Deltaproteobacteria bacterium]|nr:hypothetical protein [Deltaproteobacteria bacterium]
MQKSPLLFVSMGVILGCLATAGTLFAESRPPVPSIPAADAGGQPFEIVDTPGSTYVLNKATGQVWRLSFTDVSGNKYWYGMYAPMEPATSFEEFRARIRREKGEAR